MSHTMVCKCDCEWLSNYNKTDPIRSVIYSGKTSIHSVIVNGEIIIDNGKSTLIDENELYHKVTQLKEKYPFYAALLNWN